MMVRLTPLRLLCAAAVFCVFFLSSFVPRLLRGERGYDVFPERPPPAVSAPVPPVRFGDECSPFSAGVLEGVTFVLKIGHGEVATQLPNFLNRLGRCKQDLVIFSDRKDEVHGFEVADALAHLRPEYKFNNADFDIYDRIQALNATDQEKTPDGWRLDKYKFLPMMEWTSYMRPESEWYVFLELDTYINYDNLYRFLSTFSPKTAYYFGSPVWPAKKPTFAHGGSGFVLSRAALDKIMALGRMFGENKHFPGTHFFGVDVAKHCCGDEILAQVLKKSGVSLRGYWPMFNGEKPDTMRFDREQWCEAIITMHHLSESDFTSLSTWERARRHPERALMFEELFDMIEPQLQARKDDWSNMSDGGPVYKKKKKQKKQSPTHSVANCEKACEKDTKCVQFEYSGTECALGYAIRLGHAQGPQDGRQWTSGWIMDRIKAFKQARSPCQGARFVHSNP
ncbi:conserved hypothetical protein [Pyrenophora tritici-repentis Pt-1C-BFP]|uniref:N-acetylgalactosaminide beta-1,3-galactosyltransferase n=2 Tax=Pyrenophora tritici-repentis TaxID=45151 RepID=A0A922N7M3_9PLEO|nr:uncharacterized protein PTRG_06935 [Pyrenophora tritici-repentis Pt-1C-BFP]EDU49855.1 conserved hypothetical protein [Pyrenophora tritici-repentis Pt-1C-BFP]KAI1509049.1 Fringe [Pyrenophora tritici-repentis]